MLYEGGYDDFSVNSAIASHESPDTETRKRLEMAYLLATNPQTFELLAQNNINLFHGTNANALPNILKYGLNSGAELQNKGIDVSTGEQWSRMGGKQRKFISFTNILGIALDYSSIQPSANASKDLSFGVLIGISSNDLKNLKTCPIHSDIPEVGIMNNIPLEHIKLIAVPESKVNFVRKIIDNDKIHVTSIGIDELFYQTNPLSRTLSDEQLQELVQGIKQPEVTFNSTQIKTLAKERKKSGILNMLGTLKNKINSKGKENDSRE